MGEMPSGAIGMKSEIPLKLKGRDAFLMRAHRMECLDLLAKRDMGAVHHSSNRHGELLPAFVALNNPVARAFLWIRIKSGYACPVAMRADRTFRPTDVFENSAGFIFG